MTMHLSAYYKSAASSSALTLISAVSDPAVYTNGNDIRVTSDISNLLGEAALTAQTGPEYAQVQSPSLRTLANQDVEPIVAAVKFGATDTVQWHGENPRALTANEAINFGIYATDTSAAVNYGLVWFGDGAVKQTTGNVFSVRATGTASLSAGAWVNTTVSFDTTLPDGTYQVVGLRAEGSNLVAARIVFVGGAYRPGVPAEPAENTNYFRMFRYGKVGVFGQFDINQPPTVDCLGVTDTSQVFIFDLIKAK